MHICHFQPWNFSLCGRSRQKQRCNFMPKRVIKLNSTAWPACSHQKEQDKCMWGLKKKLLQKVCIYIKPLYRTFFRRVDIAKVRLGMWSTYIWSAAVEMSFGLCCFEFTTALKTHQKLHLDITIWKGPQGIPGSFYSDSYYMNTKLCGNNSDANVPFSILHLPFNFPNS